MYYHCYYNQKYCEFRKGLDYRIGYSTEFKYATEEEKEKLFDAIKANGYKWNYETKDFDKIRGAIFKVGDVIKSKSNYIATIIKFKDDYYYYKDKNGCGMFHISGQDQWKLVSDKFDINTLVPFESRVLVRDRNTEKWKSNFWGFYDIDSAMNYPYECCGNSFGQCIPYEGNEHLLGTTNDCEDFYKIW